MKTYKKEGRVTPCKLDKDDLYELVQMIKQNFKSLDEVEFNIYSNLPELNIRENSIDNFLNHNELPNTLNRLSLRIEGWDKNWGIIKRIELTLYNSFIHLNVEGAEETWVLGKYTQIYNYLNEKQPWFWFILKIYPFFYFLLGVFFPASILGLVYFILDGKIIYSISSLIFLISLVLLNIFNVRNTLFPYTQIIIKSKKGFINKENVTIIISVISLVVSIIGGIVIPLFK